ncbi:TVP38/TMEM64 family protein [Marinicrinis sediminis]|uniref:TVP38/TMEM64 family membrane protein n=1 Tax=Marinicrinis sediminis TaxID=1652465 RepID=A0ABW5R7X7_9BACL
MSIIENVKEISMADIQHYLNEYEALGPLPGIAAAMIEAFLPILPLFAIIVANVNAYGPVEGFLLSWIGVVLGAMSVFGLSRWLGSRFRHYMERKLRKSQGLFRWIETRGFTPIFMLSCFPFTPSALINITAGMSNLPTRVFFIAIMLGKSIMILIITLVGYDITSFLYQPWKWIVGLAILSILWLVGKRLEKRFHLSEDHRP